jgi:hypothetical protein
MGVKISGVASREVTRRVDGQVEGKTIPLGELSRKAANQRETLPIEFDRKPRDTPELRGR